MTSKFSVKILTLFPELFPGPLGASVIGSALKKNFWSIEVINIRDFALTKHRTVDSPPIGGGGGMLIRADVLGNAIDSVIQKVNDKNYSLFYLSPRGKVFDQKQAHQILQLQNIILICGRFEGIDQRIIDYYNISEISIGNYVLTGGEIAAYTVIDACVRLIPGVLGSKISLNYESFSQDHELENLVEYPQYTKPNEWRNYKVPKIILSGNHAEISKWKLEQSKEITKKLRPDLWEKYQRNQK